MFNSYQDLLCLYYFSVQYINYRLFLSDHPKLGLLNFYIGNWFRFAHFPLFLSVPAFGDSVHMRESPSFCLEYLFLEFLLVTIC